MQVAVVIPALNEAGAIGQVVTELQQVLRAAGHQPRVWVGDNGSTDATAEVAKRAGAQVVRAPRRGYGTACLAALGAISPRTDVVLFADGDGSDDPTYAPALIAPIEKNRADLVIGSRAIGAQLGLGEDGALTGPQRFGNRLATTLLRWVWGVSFTDLGPFRAIRKTTLDALRLDDRDFGWTVQMQARAATMALRTQEVAVPSRVRRAGHSKVSGEVRGSILAGTIILRTLAKEAGKAGLSAAMVSR